LAINGAAFTSFVITIWASYFTVRKLPFGPGQSSQPSFRTPPSLYFTVNQVAREHGAENENEAGGNTNFSPKEGTTPPSGRFGMAREKTQKDSERRLQVVKKFPPPSGY